MKKTIFLLVAIALLACGTALYAQDSMSQAPAAAAPQDHHPMMSPDQRLQHMTRQYNLTEDQQQKIKPLLEQEQQQMQTMRQDTSMSQQDRMAKMRELRQSTNEQIKGVLTPDQQKKWDAMQSRHMEGGMGHGQGQPVPQ